MSGNLMEAFKVDFIFVVTAMFAGVEEATLGTGDDIKGFVFGGVFGEFAKYFIKAVGHWSANGGWVLKCPFHANEKDVNTSITL
jgi:hypothetical protein